MTTLESALKKFFGYNTFRDNQKEIVEAVLKKQDVLAILPTGAGKSICYQLPAMILPGTAVVISPLISLMQDQVVSLYKNGLPAAFLNSSLEYSDMQQVLNNLKDYKLLYVAPERFADKTFIENLKRIEISLFAIDEAHCISEWGHSFRAEYRQLALLKKEFPKSSVIALTATATKDVEKDILGQLEMRSPHIVRASFDRPNLMVEIQTKTEGSRQLKKFLQKHPDKPGIIYASTRKTVDETFNELQKEGFKVTKYHAGLSDEERSKAGHDFVHGECPLIVATVAFGMGIHKPDVRFVVHLNMPKSIEQYYQEIGRAGRDGLPSLCLMLYASKDLMTYNYFLNDITDETLKRTTKRKTEQMYALCHSVSCRRKELLRYFAENYPHANCGLCDNCLDNTELIDITIPAQKILSCVYRLNSAFGIRHVIDVLRGSKVKAVLDRAHDKLSTYGIMQEHEESEIRYYIEVLLEKGFLKRSEGDYPVLEWSDTSSQITSKKTTLSVRQKIRIIEEKKKISKDLECNQELFHELTDLRRKYAVEAKVPAFVVFGDRTLIEMARSYPRNKEEMLEINGLGPIKWEKYGKAFLELIKAYCLKREDLPTAKVPLPKEKKENSSSKETLFFFSQGHSVAAIASLRSLSPKTIMDHLIEQMTLGASIDISSIVSQDKQEAIKKAIDKVGGEKLTPIKQALPESFTFEEIRLVLSKHTPTKTR